MEQAAEFTKKRHLRRPLETCGGVILSIGRVVYARSQTLKSPVFWPVKKMFEIVIALASLATPFYRHFLAILSATDDHILALIDTIETYFPSSSFIFLKIFNLLIFTETLPGKLDSVLEKLLNLFNKTIWLDWVLINTVYWLDSFVAVLDRWREKNKSTKEKEIMVDRSFSRSGSISSVEEEKKKLRIKKKRRTYKEALERGNSGGGSSGGGNSSRGDPILELFETGWIQNPIKRSSRSADSLTLSRCDSYST